MNKKFLLLLLPLLFFLPRNTSAMSLTKVELLAEDYTILRTLDSTQINDLTFATFPSTAVRRMRVYFSGLQVTAGYNYTAMIGMEARNSLVLPDTIAGVFPYVSGVYQSDCSYTFYRKGSTSGTKAGITYFDTYYEVYSNFNAITSGYILFLEFDLGSTWNMYGFGVPTNYLVANPQGGSGGGSSGGGSSSSDSNLGSEIQNSTNTIIDSNNKNANKITEEQKKTNETLKDDNVDEANSSASGFFNNFTDEDHGGISGIVKAPLVAFNAMLDDDCSPLTATYEGKEISLQCGTEFWSKLGALKTFLNLTYGGILCYLIATKLFKLVNNLKNPNNDKVEVMDL